jgi:hypothetical protein
MQYYSVIKIYSFDDVGKTRIHMQTGSTTVLLSTKFYRTVCMDTQSCATGYTCVAAHAQEIHKWRAPI